MRIPELFKEGKTVFSFEIFPPKKTSSIDTIYNTLDELSDLNPAFISVTYGAGGNTADSKTCQIASVIQDKYNITSAAHLTCVNCTKGDIDVILGQLKEKGIQNILALRGDINPDIPPKHDFKYASELVTYIKEHGDFSVSGACYPEGHMETESIIDDIKHLKIKVDAGAEHLMSQLFFDNSHFYDFLEKARIAGIDVPIEAGIMPVINKNQIERMVSMCGASLPAKFTKMMQKYEHNPEALRDAGIAYAIDQIVDLISNGVDGIHLYTMNNPYVARRISESISSLL
ncbi:MAG: methylenetetrahydrofolate reductase [NAD(P)H] [Lachnospiraceae bacterium]|nr:methylenetetrahydrofolate reductase [NAD(P)H] [Clostridiales bacterium]MDY2607283.1 methylenetetrahydrofolate reductase [NAD(P)H] [Lachnospiraceae bacterium]